MKEPTIEVNKKYALSETQTGLYVHGDELLGDEEELYNRKDAKHLLDHIKKKYPNWKITVIEKTTKTISYENVVNFGVEDE